MFISTIIEIFRRSFDSVRFDYVPTSDQIRILHEQKLSFCTMCNHKGFGTLIITNTRPCTRRIELSNHQVAVDLLHHQLPSPIHTCRDRPQVLENPIRTLPCILSILPRRKKITITQNTFFKRRRKLSRTPSMTYI